MHDVVDWLRRVPPFDAADEAALEAAAAVVEIEFHAAGASVLPAGAAGTHGYLVRAGAAELLDGARVVDRLGPGEVFGLPSVLTGEPAALEVRAGEDLLVYRLPAPVLLPLLAGPAGLRFVARTLGDRTARRLGEVPAPAPGLREVLRPAVVLAPGDPVADAVAALDGTTASAVLVRGADGRLGIVTDRDLRRRVLGRGRDASTPLGEVMTPEAVVVPPGASAEDALLLMLAHGVRQLPVVGRDGTVHGLVEDVDLLAAQGRTAFRLRRALALAPDLPALAGLAAQVPASVVAAVDAGLAPRQVLAARAVLVDVLCARLAELAVAARGPAPVPFGLLVLGSTGRRESYPTSDADVALVHLGDEDAAAVAGYVSDVASEVVSGLSRCGVPVDTHGVTPADPRFARPLAAWERALARWVEAPQHGDAATYLSALVDGREVWGAGGQELLTDVLSRTRGQRRLGRVLAQTALRLRPPTGFVRDLVVEHTGEHRGMLDLKLGGTAPVTDLARWAAVSAGSTAVDTPTRLQQAAAAGVLRQADSDALSEAFDVVAALRLEVQVEALRRGELPGNHVDPGELGTLRRRALRDAFRAVAHVQRHLQAVVAATPP